MKCNGLLEFRMGSWILTLTTLLLAALPCSSRSQHRHGNGECPHDVTGATQTCFENYHTYLLGASIENFYTGVDVENIRQICRLLSHAARCAQRVRVSCPDTEHADVEMVMQDYISLYEMCHADNFWEKYARNQNCYHNQGPSSEECYHKFQMSELGGGNYLAQTGDATAIRQLCDELDELVLCIQRRVLVSCNQEASNMVSLIVKPSVRQSESCRNSTVSKPTSPEPPPPPVNVEGKHVRPEYDVIPNMSNTFRLSALCGLLVVFIWTVALLER